MADRIIRDWQGGPPVEEEPPDDVNARLDRLEDAINRQTEAIKELVKLLGTVEVTDAPASSGYHFKVAPELLWGIGTAAGTVLIQALTDVDKIADYRTWLVGLGAALIRAGIGAALSQSKPKTEATP